MLIEFESVSVSFDAKTALDNINLKLDQKRIGVIGSGSTGVQLVTHLGKRGEERPDMRGVDALSVGRKAVRGEPCRELGAGPGVDLKGPVAQVALG